MALVSYDYGSDSDGSLENDEETSDIISKTATPRLNESESINTEKTVTVDRNNPPQEATISANSMFTSLPKSQIETNYVTNENEIEDFIPKAPEVEKKKEKVKIMIPALSEYKDDSDDDEPVHKKSKPSSKGSGLIALLPPVKSEPISTKSFVPQSVTQKTKPVEHKPVKSKALIPDSVKRKQINAAAIANKEKVTSKEPLESDDEDDIVIPESFDEEMWQKVCGRQQKKSTQYEEVLEPVEQEINIAPDPVKPYEGLDNKAFKELVGKKRKEQNINIIDINESDILPDKDMWMMKAITDPECAPKTTVENPVDPTRRRKHHITYLAEQAKANEQELQNQWSASKFSRNQTRAKYGF